MKEKWFTKRLDNLSMYLQKIILGLSKNENPPNRGFYSQFEGVVDLVDNVENILEKKQKKCEYKIREIYFGVKKLLGQTLPKIISSKENLRKAFDEWDKKYFKKEYKNL